MPIVNIYHDKTIKQNRLENSSELLKTFIADQLSCNDITLSSQEITIRLLSIESNTMIATVELEIFAYAFPKRVEKQDEICRNIRKFLLDKLPNVTDIRVWLILSELGHSW